MNLEGWIDTDKKIGHISVHTIDGKVCIAKGEYPQGRAISLIRQEVAEHPEGVIVFVPGGFRFFPMSKVSHIAFCESPVIAEYPAHVVPV